MSPLLFQGTIQNRLLRFTYYIQLSVLLCGLSGCISPFMSTKINNTAYQAAHYNLQLGLAYLQTGNRLQAKEKLFEAERQHPNAPYIKSAIAYFLEQIGEWEKAEDYHLQALKLARNDGAAHNNYGRFLCQCARYNEAESHFLQAVQDTHYMNTASAYENLGLCAMRIPNNSKAIHYLKIALKHNPKLEKSWFGLAQLHQQQKEHKLAYECLQRYQAVAVRQTPAALAVGLQLAQSLHNTKAAQHYAHMLKTQYPQSSEYQQIAANNPEWEKTE